MKKKVLAMLLGWGLVMTGLAGCGGSGEGSSENSRSLRRVQIQRKSRKKAVRAANQVPITNRQIRKGLQSALFLQKADLRDAPTMT